MQDIYEMVIVKDDETLTYHTHIPCPYYPEVEQQAWAEGYYKADADTADGIEDGIAGCPYTSADTMVAWHQGYLDWSYRPAPFDASNLWGDIDPFVAPEDNPTRSVLRTAYDAERAFDSLLVQIQKPNGQKEFYIVWRWAFGNTYADIKPAWTENREADRGIRLQKYDVRRMILDNLNTDVLGEEAITLPCPSYEFDYSDGGMSISKGVFHKWGSRDDWESVLTTMREALDEAPKGYDISNVEIEVAVTVEITTTQHVSLSSLLNRNEWYGTIDDLVDEVENSDMADYIDPSYIDIDNGYEVTEHSITDAGWDIQNGWTEL
jgi:ribosome modulation factor